MELCTGSHPIPISARWLSSLHTLLALEQHVTGLAFSLFSWHFLGNGIDHHMDQIRYMLNQHGHIKSLCCYLGRVWESSTQLRIQKNSSTPFFPAKHPSSKNSRSTKSMDLAPNSTKSMECYTNRSK
jgi:hypothetical protein